MSKKGFLQFLRFLFVPTWEIAALTASLTLATTCWANPHAHWVLGYNCYNSISFSEHVPPLFQRERVQPHRFSPKSNACKMVYKTMHCSIALESVSFQQYFKKWFEWVLSVNTFLRSWRCFLVKSGYTLCFSTIDPFRAVFTWLS